MKLTRFFFFATVFCVTFEKLYWNVAGAVSISDILALGFLAGYLSNRLASRDGRLPRAALVIIGFFLAFALVYLVGWFNLDSHEAVSQYVKGMIKWAIHFLFLVCGVLYLQRRSERFYWQTIGVFTAGLVFNCAYGVVQLLAARSGVNLDSQVLSPLTGGASNINIYGAVDGASVFRINALTGDPNHLGVMLVIPILSLLPVYLRLERRHPLRTRLAWVLGFMLLIEIATLSRSGWLGLIVGAVVLALPYRRFAASRALLMPAGVVAAVLAIVVFSRYAYFSRVIRSRFETGGGSADVHLGVYDFIPHVLHQHPFFGLGLNNFSVYYELVTGKTNFGPHSFYVSVIVETGLVGALLLAFFVGYLFVRLDVSRALGRRLARLGDVRAARVRPLAWGMTAALAGTLAANVFYLTMSFYYFYVFATLILALPLVFGRPAVRDAQP